MRSNRGIGGRVEENDFKDDLSGFFITTCAACTLGDTTAAVIVGLEILLVGATLPPLARGVTWKWSRSFELPRRWG